MYFLRISASFQNITKSLHNVTVNASDCPFYFSWGYYSLWRTILVSWSSLLSARLFPEEFYKWSINIQILLEIRAWFALFVLVSIWERRWAWAFCAIPVWKNMSFIESWAFISITIVFLIELATYKSFQIKAWIGFVYETVSNRGKNNIRSSKL